MVSTTHKQNNSDIANQPADSKVLTLLVADMMVSYYDNKRYIWVQSNGQKTLLTSYDVVYLMLSSWLVILLTVYICNNCIMRWEQGKSTEKKEGKGQEEK